MYKLTFYSPLKVYNPSGTTIQLAFQLSLLIRKGKEIEEPTEDTPYCAKSNPYQQGEEQEASPWLLHGHWVGKDVTSQLYVCLSRCPAVIQGCSNPNKAN